jgi:hypothetical protein
MFLVEDFLFDVEAKDGGEEVMVDGGDMLGTNCSCRRFIISILGDVVVVYPEPQPELAYPVGIQVFDKFQ